MEWGGEGERAGECGRGEEKAAEWGGEVAMEWSGEGRGGVNGVVRGGAVE